MARCSKLEVFLQVGTARNVLWRLKDCDLVGAANDGPRMKCCGRHAGNEICQRADAIHEDPEAGQGLGRLEDAVETET